MMNWVGISVEGRAVDVNVADEADLLRDLETCLSSGRGFTVATLNLDHVVKLRGDPEFQRAYLAHSHVTADGRPIVWLSRLAGKPVALVPGSELIEPVIALCARLGVPVAFLGSTDATLNEAKARLETRYPGLSVVATLAPSHNFDPTGAEAETCLKALEASGARLCFLALGAPKQERFAAHAQQRLTDLGLISIGAGLDFIAGTQVRAPKLARAVAAEWLWRLLKDPRRLAGRYAACVVVLPSLLVTALSTRRAAGRSDV